MLEFINLILEVKLSNKFFSLTLTWVAPAHMHVVLNRRAVWYGYNVALCVDPTCMRVIVFQTAAGICLQPRLIL
jgi:hypothetical protein